MERVREANDCSNVIPEINISINMPVIKQKTTIANVSAAALRILNGPFLDINLLSPTHKYQTNGLDDEIHPVE